jgi:DHA3 family macrolide efflux protein-like MFS transporter
LFFTWWNFLLNGPLELAIPFILHRSNSDLALSWLLGFMNAGALAGALITVCGLTFRRRLVPMFAGVLLTSSMFIVFGMSSNVWIMGISLTLLMPPLAMTGSLFTSLIQINVPSAYQGRVFAAVGQLAAISAPLSFLITGPLVDNWLEPIMRNGNWPLLSALFGANEGAGIGLLLSSTGVLLLLGIIPAVLIREVRKLESRSSEDN